MQFLRKHFITNLVIAVFLGVLIYTSVNSAQKSLEQPFGQTFSKEEADASPPPPPVEPPLPKAERRPPPPPVVDKIEMQVEDQIARILYQGVTDRMPARVKARFINGMRLENRKAPWRTKEFLKAARAARPHLIQHQDIALSLMKASVWREPIRQEPIRQAPVRK